MAKKIIRLISLAADGSFREREFEDFEELNKMHEQIGIDDCSTDLSLRGFPIYRGLVGPIPEGKKVARYESPEVFEALTKEWSKVKTKRRRRRSSTNEETTKPTVVPPPMAIPMGVNMISTPSEFA